MRPPCPSRHHSRSRGPNAPPIRPTGPKRRQPKSSCCNLASALPKAKPCANRVVTTRRQPVVTTRKLPQPTRTYGGWRKWRPQVTGSPRVKTPDRATRSAPAHSPRAMSAQAQSGAPGALGQGLNPMNRLAAAIVIIGANAACRGGEKEDLGTKREWCPVSLVVSATPRRSVRTETLI